MEDPSWNILELHRNSRLAVSEADLADELPRQTSGKTYERRRCEAHRVGRGRRIRPRA